MKDWRQETPRADQRFPVDQKMGERAPEEQGRGRPAGLAHAVNHLARETIGSNMKNRLPW